MNTRNKLLICLFLYILCGNIQAQNRVSFDYDSAGNQIKRFVCINCNGRTAITDSINEVSDVIVDQNLSGRISKLSYYPNPVSEILTIKYESEETYISSIEVYSLNGKFLEKYENINNYQTLELNFLNQPQGFYSVLIFYSDGKNKSIKIVKK
jgi:hypothetical protein